LTAAFHTKTPWSLRLLNPTGHDAEIGDRPAKVCLTGGADGATHCEEIRGDGYGFQTIKGAAVEPLSAKARLSGVVVRSEYSGGSVPAERTDIWTYQAASDSFERISGFTRSHLGEEERFASGPLDGFYILADFLLGADENRWSDHRYSIEVYQLDPRAIGYIQVLQYLSPSAYPSERNGPHQVIDGELARTRHLLKAVYPNGIQAGPTPSR
jgi:hypothetical protein